MPESSASQLDKLFGECLQEGSDFEVVVGRDQRDDYFIDIKKMKSDLLYDLSREDIFLTVPMGTHWQPGLGWHSYFGIPFQFKGTWWIAIGFQEIVKHPTRGSYPKSRAFLFSFDTSLEGNKNSNLVQNLQRWTKVLEDGKPNMTRLQRDYGSIPVNSATPAEHIWAEIEIIKLAAKQYSVGKPVLFRTLLLSEDQRPGRESTIIDIPQAVRDVLRNPRKYIIAENAITSRRSFTELPQSRGRSPSRQQSPASPETSRPEQGESTSIPNSSNLASEKKSRNEHRAIPRNQPYVASRGQYGLCKVCSAIVKSFQHRLRK